MFILLGATSDNHFAPPSKISQQQVAIILPPANITWLRSCVGPGP